MDSSNHAIYWGFVDLATKVYNALWQQGLILVGIPQGRDYLECHCVDKNDVKAPFQAIRLEAVISSPAIMQVLLSYGYKEAREEFIDDAAR
jgi:hypothetical protein